MGKAVRGQLFHILTDYVPEKKDDPRIAPQPKTKTAKPRTGSSPQAGRQKNPNPITAEPLAKVVFADKS